MSPDPSFDEFRQQCLDAIQANQAMLAKLSSRPNVDEKRKLEMVGRILDTSADLAELLAMIDQQSKGN